MIPPVRPPTQDAQADYLESTRPPLLKVLSVLLTSLVGLPIAIVALLAIVVTAPFLLLMLCASFLHELLSSYAPNLRRHLNTRPFQALAPFAALLPRV